MHLAIHDGRIYGGRAQDTDAGRMDGFLCSIDNAMWSEYADLFVGVKPSPPGPKDVNPPDSITALEFAERLENADVPDTGTDRWFGPEANPAYVIRRTAEAIRKRF